MGKRTEAQRQKYIHDFARTCMGKFRISADDSGLTRYDFQSVVALMHSEPFEQKLLDLKYYLREQTDEVMGRLAACGLSGHSPHQARLVTLFEAIKWSGEDPPQSEFGGFHMLKHLAYLAVYAAIIDNIRDDLRKKRIF